MAAETGDGRMCVICRSTWLASRQTDCPYQAQHADVLASLRKPR